MNWEALATAVRDRRAEMGHPTRDSFINASGLSARTLGDIETARRDSYSPDTLAKLERALDWPAGAAMRIVNGKEAERPVAEALAAHALDPRSLERYGDELELLGIVVDADLSPADAFRLVLRLRQRRADQHAELVRELRAAVAELRAARDGAGDRQA